MLPSQIYQAARLNDSSIHGIYHAALESRIYKACCFSFQFWRCLLFLFVFVVVVDVRPLVSREFLY